MGKNDISGMSQEENPRPIASYKVINVPNVSTINKYPICGIYCLLLKTTFRNKNSAVGLMKQPFSDKYKV